jgi:putative membrane protein
MGLLITWLLLTLAVLATAWIIPGFKIRGIGSAVLVAALFGVLNVLIGWLLFAVIGIATLGLGFLLAFVTRWIVNAILLKIVDGLTSHLSIRSFGTALVAALVMSGLGTLFEWGFQALTG